MKELFCQYKESLKDRLRLGVLRADALFDYGLSKGKLGMAILFYEYSRYSGDGMYEQFGDELVTSLLDLPQGLPLNIECGLSGIGWGLVYLFREKFIEGDLDEVLFNIDTHLMDAEIREEEDLKSLLSYVRFRQLYVQQCGIECVLEKQYFDRIAGLKEAYGGSLYTEEEVIKIIWDSWKI